MLGANFVGINRMSQKKSWIQEKQTWQGLDNYE